MARIRLTEPQAKFLHELLSEKLMTFRAGSSSEKNRADINMAESAKRELERTMDDFGWKP